MKAYVDVSLTLEEDLSHWTEEEKDKITGNIEKAIEFARGHILEKLRGYEDIIKDLDVAVTFEDRS